MSMSEMERTREGVRKLREEDRCSGEKVIKNTGSEERAQMLIRIVPCNKVRFRPKPVEISTAFLRPPLNVQLLTLKWLFEQFAATDGKSRKDQNFRSTRSQFFSFIFDLPKDLLLNFYFVLFDLDWQVCLLFRRR